MEQQEIKKNIQNMAQWIRLVYMVLFCIILWPVSVILSVVVFVQLLFALVMGKTNENIQKFSAHLTLYLNQIVLFLTYNEEGKPFPFAAWGEVETAVVDVTNTQTAAEVVKDDENQSAQ